MNTYVWRWLCILPMTLTMVHLTRATTIIPFRDLGVLTASSEAVVSARVVDQYEYYENGITYFRSKLVVVDPIKGDLGEGAEFEIQKWEKRIGDARMTMWGDIELYKGSTFLLFMNKRKSGLYHPICYSYYIFEEITMDGTAYMVPSEAGEEFILHEADGVEPIYVYESGLLREELRATSLGKKEWDSTSARTELQQEAFYGARYARSAPNYCDYISSGGTFFRWQDFESSPVVVHYSTTEIADCPGSSTYAQQAVIDLNAAYPGVSLIDGGSFTRSDPCVNGSAIGSGFRSWVNAEFGGSRHIVIQYDDPCDDILDLDSRCGGILAQGGLYGIGSHQYNGETWFTGAYGYVLVNEATGQCQCSNMQEIIDHELTHALGIGHVDEGNPANMNSVCCNDITSYDQTCVEHSYASASGSLLPLELLYFDGEMQAYTNQLVWETAWEADIDAYVVERATDGSLSNFEELVRIKSKGDSDEGHRYSWTDQSPGWKSYYRLKHIELSGEVAFSQIVVLQREQLEQPVLYPTSTRDQIHLRVPESYRDARITIANITGREQLQQAVAGPLTVVTVGDLPEGWYYLQLAADEVLTTFKFFKQE